MDRSGLHYALSNSDIEGLLDGKVKIVRYRDLRKYTCIDLLLQPYDKVFILYENRDGYGHWTLLHKLNNRNIELFDSYGLHVDDELDYISKSYRKQSDQFKAHLSHLLIDSPYRIHYNDTPLQEAMKGVSTCGRWCVARAVNNSMSIEKFCSLIKQESKRLHLTYDDLVCALVKL